MKLSKYLKPYMLFALLTPLTMVGEVMVDLLQPKLMSKIVDEGVLGQDMGLIILFRTGRRGFAGLRARPAKRCL